MAITRKWLLVVSLSALAIVAVVTAFWPRRVVDYGSGAAGLVVDAEGSPVSGANVTIDFDRRVFDAITPVRKAQPVTDDHGRFQDFFISCGKPGGHYTVTVEKSGFQPAHVVGEGMGHHRIVLLPEVQPKTNTPRDGAG